MRHYFGENACRLRKVYVLSLKSKSVLFSNKYIRKRDVYEEKTFAYIDETFKVSGAGKYRCLVMHIAYTDAGLEIEAEPFYTNIVTLY